MDMILVFTSNTARHTAKQISIGPFLRMAEYSFEREVEGIRNSAVVNQRQGFFLLLLFLTKTAD